MINSTGPESDVRRIDDRLLSALLARGLARPDPLGLGLDVDDAGALYDAAGVASRTLFVLGPLLRGRDWESTAVPELRSLAVHLAERLARDAPTSS